MAPSVGETRQTLVKMAGDGPRDWTVIELQGLMEARDGTTVNGEANPKPSSSSFPCPQHDGDPLPLLPATRALLLLHLLLTPKLDANCQAFHSGSWRGRGKRA